MTKSTEKKKWSGSTICDFCKSDLDVPYHKPWFVDGRTIYGSWAVMCPDCWHELGLGLGTGAGQKYDSRTLERIEG